MFELSEEAFDQVAVKEGTEGEASPAVALGKDVGEAVLHCDLRAGGVAVIDLVCKEYTAWICAPLSIKQPAEPAYAVR